MKNINAQALLRAIANLPMPEYKGQAITVPIDLFQETVEEAMALEGASIPPTKIRPLLTFEAVSRPSSRALAEGHARFRLEWVLVENEPHKAPFLWPHSKGSVEEAGYEFANAQTEEYRQNWWLSLQDRMARKTED